MAMVYTLPTRRLFVLFVFGTAVVLMILIFAPSEKSCRGQAWESASLLTGCHVYTTSADDAADKGKRGWSSAPSGTTTERLFGESHAGFSQNTSASWFLTQRNRRLQVQNICLNDSYDPNNKLDLLTSPIHVQDDCKQMFVDPKHKVLYCAIPKVACSSWKGVIAALTGAPEVEGIAPGNIHDVHDRNFMRKIGILQLHDFSDDEIRYILTNYTKFMMVRHPFERLVSAFRDKFQTNNKWTRTFQRKYGKVIVRLYRENPSAEALAKGNDITFREFVTYLTDPSVSEKYKWNPHWSSYQDLCHPCLVKYNYILKYESFATDSETLLELAYGFRNGSQMLPKRNAHAISSKDRMDDLLRNVTMSHIYRLSQLYKTDFEMFGYTPTWEDLVVK